MKEKFTLKQFIQWLDGFLNFEKLPQKNIFWLDTMRYFCSILDNPQKRPTIHVAGSKGKGSVSAMLCQILEESGYKTGLYSSPHLVDFTERITRNRKFFSDKIYKTAAQELFNAVTENQNKKDLCRPITWFELVTLFGFLCFKKAKTDWNVLEVGLGGRLDATNICEPQICVINTIELEHTEFLGDTEEQIAAEKAGIIKEGIPVICAQQKPSVNNVIKETAQARHAPLYFFDDLVSDLTWNYYRTKTGSVRMKVNFISPLYDRPLSLDLKLAGSFQAKNAALSAVTAKLLMKNIKQKKVEKALGKVTLPARFEIQKISDIYTVLDGAHTVKSIESTVQTWINIFSQKPSCLLFACAKDKNVEEMAKNFKGIFTRVILTRPGDTKACDPDKMMEAFDKAQVKYVYEPNFKKAIKDSVREAEEHHMNLLVTGSFYLCAEFQSR